MGRDQSGIKLAQLAIMAAKFERYVRFEDPNGKIHHGEAGLDWQKDLVGQTVPTYNISDVFDGQYPLTGDKAEIAKVVSSSCQV